MFLLRQTMFNCVAQLILQLCLFWFFVSLSNFGLRRPCFAQAMPHSVAKSATFKKWFDESDKDKSGDLDFKQFQVLFERSLKTRLAPFSCIKVLRCRVHLHQSFIRQDPRPATCATAFQRRRRSRQARVLQSSETASHHVFGLVSCIIL